MQRIAVAVLALTLVSGTASAQSPVGGTVEISAGGAVNHLTDDESYLGAGGQLSGGVSCRLSRRLTVGVQVEGFRHDRHFDSGVEFKASGAAVVGELLFWFGSSKVRPFAGPVFGLITVHQHNRYPRTVPGPHGLPVADGFDQTSNATREEVWGGAGGVDIAAGKRLFVRPGASVRLSRSFFISIQYGLSVGWRW
jgi:hypothetical protein